MKQRWYGVSVLVAVLAALTLSGLAMATGKSVPFKGRSSGVATTVEVDPVAGVATLSVEAQGQATHLGRFTATAEAQAVLSTGNATGAWTLTAANGDMLFATMTASPLPGDPRTGIANFTITGGTGRFAGASGAYQQFITFDVVPGSSATAAFTDRLEGTISFGHP